MNSYWPIEHLLDSSSEVAQRTLYTNLWMHPMYWAYMDCFETTNVSAKGNFGLKTNLVVSSTKFCQAIFDEGDMGRGLGGSSDHVWIIH